MFMLTIYLSFYLNTAFLHKSTGTGFLIQLGLGITDWPKLLVSLRILGTYVYATQGKHQKHGTLAIDLSLSRKGLCSNVVHTPSRESSQDGLIWLKNTLQLLGLVKTSHLGYFPTRV